MSTMNFYVVLGIAEDADSDTIRSAFRALARRYHPDAGAGSSTAEFRRALEAYETLSDPSRRRLHDRHLRGARVRQTTIAAPIVSTSRTVSFGFPTTRVTVTRSRLFDALFDQLQEDWFWRWRVR